MEAAACLKMSGSLSRYRNFLRTENANFRFHRKLYATEIKVDYSISYAVASVRKYNAYKKAQSKSENPQRSAAVRNFYAYERSEVDTPSIRKFNAYEVFWIYSTSSTRFLKGPELPGCKYCKSRINLNALNFRPLLTSDMSYIGNSVQPLTAAESLTCFELLVRNIFSHGSRLVRNIWKYNAYEWHIFWIYINWIRWLTNLLCSKLDLKWNWSDYRSPESNGAIFFRNSSRQCKLIILISYITDDVFLLRYNNLTSQWGEFTIRFYSRGIPFPGSHCGANRSSLSSVVHSFRSCWGGRASLLGWKNSNKSISNLMEALATRPEGWTCSILKDICV